MSRGRRRFPGQYFDQETNSHYNFHRDYKSNQGRYIQSDPIGTDGGVNLYSYSYVNPLTYIDTTGEVPWIGLPALYCVRFPRVCKEILRCIISPRACKKKLCRFGNAIYAACHSLPTCVPCGESCVASQGINYLLYFKAFDESLLQRQSQP